ncbi:YlbL family protein [Microtetraspora niveoalba]|uniref:YlbL family protein n=1 Tax=Microtetraspora niveoalba TaxID=46175 RepID=UPI000836A9E1|nr:PDZ domain-containing protein [Microtetraspora niveoalba]
MSRRALTLLVAGFLTVILAVAAAWLPVPYVVLNPGPTENTIGEVKGKPVISISDHATYPTEGKLSMVTVAYQGGPGNAIDLITALRGWLDSSIAVVPEETIFPRTSTPKEIEQQNSLDMTTSQEAATIAALHALKIPVPEVVSVVAVEKGLPADGKLQLGDEVTAVNGTAVSNQNAVAEAVRKAKPGDQVRLTVNRKDAPVDVTLGTVAGDDGKARVGVTMGMRYKPPFKVDISVGDIGGPSAGLMFSLGIYDKLTPGALTGGKSIAGTGTISVDGAVGPIGGIEQKMAGARKAGATIFLTPARNCAQALRAAPEGLRLVKVETLDGAIKAIDALRTGTGDVPACTGN